MPRFFALFFFALVLDQASKFWVEARYAFLQFEPVTPFLNIGLTYNPGAAFSFLADHNGWQRWLFTALALAATVFLWRQIRRTADSAAFGLQNIGYTLIASGVIGNAIDRLRIAKVVDFIDLHVAGYHWPAFNIADSCIFIGVVLVLWFEFSGASRKAQSHS